MELRSEQLADWLAERGPEWAGLSLTMPLKQTVLPLLDDVSPLAAATGAANTVLLGPAGRTGDNTDVPGLVDALREAGTGAVSRSVVLGGGATAASALAALAAVGDRAPLVLVREPQRCAPLLAAAERLGSAPQVRRLDLDDPRPVLAREVDVVVNTTPLGAADALAEALPRPALGAPLLVDVVYDPWPTRLAQAWPGVAVGGALMLLHQAAHQVELMTGRAAPLDAMRRALEPRLLPSPGPERSSRPRGA